MASLTTIDDASIELACIIDMDTFTPLPIVAAGADRTALLTAFVDSVPFDITLLNAETIREGFSQFLGTRGIITQDTPTQADQPEVVASDGTPDDGVAALAEREATYATDTPSEQPADTDEAQDTQSPTVTARCWNCDGSGRVEFGEGEPTAQCGICQGTGKVEQAVQA